MEAGAPTIVAYGEASAAETRRRLAALRARISGAPDRVGLPLPEADAAVPDQRAPVRVAFAAASAREALRAIDVLDRWLALDPLPALRVDRGVVLASGSARPRVGLLLPGQGVPAPRHLGLLARCFPEVAAAHARVAIPRAANGEIAPPAIQLAIVAASLAALDVVRRLRVAPSFALGHSLGELTALSWAGAFDEADALRLARARGEAMVTRAGAPGGMAAVAADPALLARLLDGSQLSIACFNGPERHVVAGAETALDAFLVRAEEQGVTATRLDVTGAFHTPLMQDAAAAFDGALARRPARPLRGRVISSVTSTWLAADADLRAHLRDQMLAPVRFLDAVRVAAAHAELLIEAGPGGALRALTAEVDDAVPVVSPSPGDRSPRRLLELLATTWACGFTPMATVSATLEHLGAAQPSASRRRRFNAATTSS